MSELEAIVGAEHVLRERALRPYLSDATEARGLSGRADAAVRPADAGEVAEVVAWCYDNDVPITPRGGGSGYAGGAVPDGGVVVSTERLRDTRSFDPLLCGEPTSRPA